MSRPPGSAESPSPGPVGPLDRRLCQVVGLNQNYVSASGTLYHVQIEDRGPVLDRVTETEVRRVNVIAYANYGEPNARIVWGRDYDFPDVRSHEHNRFVSDRIQELWAESRTVIEEKERRMVARLKGLIREYYLTKREEAKREFEDANALFPFLFSKAWRELKGEKAAGVVEAPPPPPVNERVEEAPEPEEVLYPLDLELRERVLEIERIIIELAGDLRRLKAAGKADDILLQTCRKLVSRAKDSLAGKEPSEFNTKRLDVMRNSLMTTWRQVHSRLRDT
ncbi:MAG TPA: hypothetical protein VJU18_00765 [Vicinamibacteria bacterium]|nr:hypothetical protein [Vicinamibacteria bacterium]